MRIILSCLSICAALIAPSVALADPDVAVSKFLELASDPGVSFDCVADDPDPNAAYFAPGSCITYTIEVTNSLQGTSPALDLKVVDQLPEGVVFIAQRAVTGFDEIVVDGNRIDAQIASLEPGGNASLVFRALLQ